MKGKNPQRFALESNIFEIPADYYEKYMNLELSKEKRDKILNLFTNYNQLHSEEELILIKEQLNEACKECDLESIKILLSETITNEANDLVFKIDKISETASLFKISGKSEHIIIPQTVKHESKEYLVTGILSLCKL